MTFLRVLSETLALGVKVLETAAWLFMMLALSSFLAMNFTGASTYTSLSGVKREMRYAVPLQIAAATIGLVLWTTVRFMV